MFNRMCLMSQQCDIRGWCHIQEDVTRCLGFPTMVHLPPALMVDRNESDVTRRRGSSSRGQMTLKLNIKGKWRSLIPSPVRVKWSIKQIHPPDSMEIKISHRHCNLNHNCHHCKQPFNNFLGPREPLRVPSMSGTLVQIKSRIIVNYGEEKPIARILPIAHHCPSEETITNFWWNFTCYEDQPILWKQPILGNPSVHNHVADLTNSIWSSCICAMNIKGLDLSFAELWIVATFVALVATDLHILFLWLMDSKYFKSLHLTPTPGQWASCPVTN